MALSEDPQHQARTTNLGAASARSIRRFTVSVISDKKGQTVRSVGERVVIGRHKTAELVLRDESVSQFHCEVEVQADRLIVRDLGSTNGTQLDGVTIREAYAQPKSVLTIGRTKLRIDVGDERLGLPSLHRERFQQIVGRSAPMQELYATLELAASSESTVLIEGETGSGKEAVAESIHLVSSRNRGPFHVVDCGALPATLLEAELFGYERGAFTGAHTERQGVFEAANGGTVFLDEIGELALDLQPKLLRVLEKREVKRIGSTKYFPVNCRILAATLRDLRASVNDRRFRPDLFYRLAVVPIRVPPLRARTDDIPFLVDHFLELLGAGDGPVGAMLRDPATMRQLQEHSWPGNVRELRNYVERCVTFGGTHPLTPDENAEPSIDGQLPWRGQREKWLRHLERRYLRAVLVATDNNVSEAARKAGMDRASFYRLMWKAQVR